MIDDSRFAFPDGVALHGVGAVAVGLRPVRDQSVYSRSLGINANLWAGTGILVFGLAMLASGWRAMKATSRGE